MPIVEVTIADNGDITTEVQGVKGSSCANIADAIKTLFGTARKEEKTADYYKTVTPGITTTV